MNFTKEILSIDLGKFNSVFCRFDFETKKAEVRTIPSTPDQVRQALLRKSGQTVVMEACSNGASDSESGGTRSRMNLLGLFGIGG